MSEKFLLDTHTWLWLAIGDERIPQELIGTLETAIKNGLVFLCQISVWELAMKEAKGKLAFNRPFNVWVKENTARLGLLDIPLEVAIDATRLPGDFHKDPADRLIVATARHYGMTLVTGDGLILSYAEQGHVKVLAV
jgi:PIN domain nuclease of toxin-antitoxin system